MISVTPRACTLTSGGTEVGGGGGGGERERGRKKKKKETKKHRGRQLKKGGKKTEHVAEGNEERGEWGRGSERGEHLLTVRSFVLSSSGTREGSSSTRLLGSNSLLVATTKRRRERES
mgnify:CR=1 FL=1